MFNKSLNENYKYGKKLGGNFRLLGKYKQYNDSNSTVLKEDMSSKGGYEKKYITNNKTGYKRKNEKSNKNILNKAQYYIEVVDYNNGMFDGKHFHFNKKWIKKKDYDYFLEKNRRIRDIALKKIKFKNYGFGVALFLIFVLLGIGLSINGVYHLPSESAQSDGNTNIGFVILKFLKETLNFEKVGHVYILLFAVAFIMLSVLIIVAIYKILRNNEKYQKIKLITTGYE
ncbi:Plasmodium exported protein (Pm-fam-a like), unknown function [Plasmodium malariae]|uniref:Fam-m protein n=1 Tax=Plasmodium malariae TaxID=5858 RepID=A0A1A8WJP1_PLAMA|nr:Plasmodium exported protein (Pm-fam-a like), unknown function [Plasmodium malariae]